MAEIYLNDIAHGRSGDKGDTSNVCVYARKPEYYKIIEREVTPEKLKAYFGDPLRCPQPERLQLCYEARSGRRCHHEPASGQPGQIHGQCRDAHEDPR